MTTHESIGNYSQSIRKGTHNYVKIVVSGKVLYDGVACHIIDEKDKISFKTPEGEQKEFIKYVKIKNA